MFQNSESYLFIQSLCLLQDLSIVHNDLKPDNILINFTGDSITDLKLSDFGSAHIFGSLQTQSTATPEYVPPENLLRTNYPTEPHSTDIWSFGVILLEILTGMPVWLNFKCQVNQGNRTTYK